MFCIEHLNQMYIKKKPSLGKINEKKLSSTAREMFYPQEKKITIDSTEPIKVPTFRRNLRNVSSKVIEQKPRIETQTTLSETSMMFQSMYGTSKDWLKPSDYVKQITELNLLGEDKDVEIKQYEIKLSDKLQINLEKYQRLKEVTEKWVMVLRKALSYLNSTKASTDKLIEQIKFWKVLSRKFDQLQYEFKEQKTVSLLAIMKNVLKTEPAYRPILEDFITLKEQIIALTPAIKKLHLQLESISGFILKLEQCSYICESVELLKKILIGFDSVIEENPLVRQRVCVIYQKIDQCMTKQLLATSLMPRELANISSVKQHYQIIDHVLSFYSNFLNSLEGSELSAGQLIDTVQYRRQVVGNLLQILSYFQFLYNNKEVHQFSKLFSHILNYNIYDKENRNEWNHYMDIVNSSMEIHHFQP